MSHSSRRAYTGASDSNCATYDDYQNLSHRPLQHRVHELRGQATVTRYRIDTADNFTTSYYDCREYTAHETHRSSFGNHVPLKGHRDPARLLRGNSRIPEASFERNHTYTHGPKQELRIPSERRDSRRSKSDRRYSSDYDTVHEKRSSREAQHSADKGTSTNSAHAKSSQQEELKPAYGSGYSGISRPHSSNKPPRSDHYNYEKSNNSRRNDSRQGKSRSNRNNSSHELPEPQPQQARDILPDFYAILQIGHRATDDQIRSAAKRRRVEVHPDKLKRPGMSESEMDEIDAEASRVGQASDVLLNPEQKLKYDRKLYAAKGLQ